MDALGPLGAYLYVCHAYMSMQINGQNQATAGNGEYWLQARPNS